MPSIGAFGTMGDSGSSTHVVSTPSAYYSIAYWNEKTKKFSFVDYNGSYYPAVDADGFELGSYDLKCMKALISYAGGETCCFLMCNPADETQRQLYFFSLGYSGAKLTEVRNLDPTSHAGRAQLYAVNGQQSTVMYCIDDNKLYAYDLGGHIAERQMTLEGLPANEKITYIANRWFDTAWDYLFVGTQSGDTYKVYMYNMVGGEPVGQPAMTFSGKGKLRKVDYADPEFQSCEQVTVLDD